MTTWTRDNVASAIWTGAGTILYLLTEAGENLLDEVYDLILIDRKQLANWTRDNVPVTSWSQVTIN